MADRSLPDHTKFDNFGSLIQYLRTSYMERAGARRGDGLDVAPSQMDLVRCMKKHGYSISSGTISLLEANKTLPQKPQAFMDALCKCLGIQQSDFYWYLLRYQYAYDHLARSAGRALASQVIPVGDVLGQLYLDGKLPTTSTEHDIVAAH